MKTLLPYVLMTIGLMIFSHGSVCQKPIDTHPLPQVCICCMTPISHGHARFKAGTRDWFWQIQNSIVRIAQNNDVGLIDLHTPLYSRPDLFSDNVHPTTEGAIIIAREVYQQLIGDFGGLQMPMVFDNQMVIQRVMKVPVWGTANYNERIRIEFKDLVLETDTDIYGNWKVEFPPMRAGGPYGLKVSTDDKTMVFEDILIGEDLNVPIGLILKAKGGSSAESWIDRNSLEFHPRLVDILNDWKNNEMIMGWSRDRGAYNIQNAKNSMQRHQFEPAYLFEAGIMPLTKVPIRGVIWYQGESNANSVELYEILFPTLVKNWRNARGDSLFCFVQLSSLNRPYFRDSQRRMNKAIPNAVMVVSSDLGDPTDVHPKQKKKIGQRLALGAEVNTYGIEKEFIGPEFLKVEEGNGKMIVYFDHAAGLNSTNDELVGFELAGDNKIYKGATAKIDGEKAVLFSDIIKNPTYVRYAWKPFTEANLFNESGLPTSTFSSEFQIENNKTKYEKD